MIHVFVSPGTLDGKPLRSMLYDTVSDKYGQFLREELLPEVYAKYNIRKDAYSRAIQGQSSGGIAAFTVACNHPESSAASTPSSAASSRFSGSPASSTAATSIRSRCGASRSAICACG